jgi:hypothetical protein
MNQVHVKTPFKYSGRLTNSPLRLKLFSGEMILKALALSLFLSFTGFCEGSDADTTIIVGSVSEYTPLSTLGDAFKNHRGNFQVLQSGIIISVLKDDNKGTRHQRIIVRLENGQTLLIAHNIDIADRVPNPKNNKWLVFYGEYEWNAKGGVIHWTHRNPGGRHVDGWLEYEGKKYQ